MSQKKAKALPQLSPALTWLKWLLVFIICSTFIGLAATVFLKRNNIARAAFSFRKNIPIIAKPESPKPDVARWNLLRKDLERWRVFHADRYRKAKSATEKKAVLADARKLLEHNLPELMRCWLGTPWDFHGTAKEPGGGKIACGYYVSTVLEGAGFRVQRIPLAQQASQNIIRTFLPANELNIRAGVPYKTYRAETSRNQPGIYIVGLDSHVAFLVVRQDKPEEFLFIHSSGAKPWCVVEENPDQANVLARSNYRVTGNITSNENVIRRWLMGESFLTHK